MMQALHPAVAAGFVAHSNYRAEPFERMLRTTTFIRHVTFGDEQSAIRRITEVRELHARVVGCTPEGTEYSAEDPELLEWVFLCFVFGFAKGFAAFGQRGLSADVLDSYVRDMSRIGLAFGLAWVPVTLDELEKRVEDLGQQIEPSRESRELIAYLRNPPSWGRIGRVENRLVMRSAGSLLPESLVCKGAKAGVPMRYRRLARLVTRAMIGLVRWSCGPDPNLEAADLRPISAR
jgi:uncharacterized protein (DUF2236 family)